MLVKHIIFQEAAHLGGTDSEQVSYLVMPYVLGSEAEYGYAIKPLPDVFSETRCGTMEEAVDQLKSKHPGLGMTVKDLNWPPFGPEEIRAARDRG
jgi:hypothetical protein